MAEDRTERFERRVAPALAALTVLFLVAYAVPILEPDLPARWQQVFSAAAWVSWAVFIAEFLWRLRLTEDRWTFVRRHPLDLLLIVLPLLRPLRLLRLITLLSVADRLGGRSLHGRIAVYLVGSASLLVLVASLAVLDAERGRGGSIQTFGDAVWWAVTTITTVGYGDMFPVTATGRVVAASLMISGIAALGVVTASIASWLVQRVAEADASQDRLREDVTALKQELALLRRSIESGSQDR